jgi:hypothetical protein
MPDFPGRLTVINGQSSLNNDLLLRGTSSSDVTQAIANATQFLLKTKGLMSGQQIIVTGTRGSFGNLSVIGITNARPDPSQPFAFALTEAVSPTTTKRRRAGAKKSKSRAGKSSAKKK